MGTPLLRYRRHATIGMCALLLAFTGGCRESTGSVSGQVLYKDKPLPGGLVTFVPSEPGHNAVVARLDEDGHYEATVPAGEVQISVDNRELQAQGKRPSFAPPPGAKIPPGTKGEKTESLSAAKKPPGNYVEIPEKYYRIETSGLHMTVQSGSQTRKIELK